MKSLDDIKPHVRLMRKIGMQLDVLPYNTVLPHKDLLDGAEMVNVPLGQGGSNARSPLRDPPHGEGGGHSEEGVCDGPGVLRGRNARDRARGIMEAFAKPLGHEGLLRMRSLNYEPYTWHILSGRTGSIVSQADSPMGGLGLSPAFPVGAA